MPMALHMKLLGRFLLKTAVVSAGVMLLLAACLPVVVEKAVLPGLVAAYHLPPLACQVRRIGWGGADLGSLRVGGADEPALTAAAVQLDYTLAGLWQRRIRAITVSGLELRGRLQDGALTLSGIDLAKLQHAFPAGGPVSGGGPDLSIGRLDVVGSRISLAVNKADFRLPFTLRQVSLDRGRQVLSGRFSLFPFAQQVEGDWTVDFTRQAGTLSLAADRLSLPRLAEGVPAGDALRVGGEMRLNGGIDFRLSPFEIQSASIAAFLDHFTAHFQGVAVAGSGHSGPDAAQGVGLTLEKQEGHPWQFTTSALVLANRLRLEGMSLSWAKTEGKQRLEGEVGLSLSLPDRDEPPDRGASRPPRLTGRLEAFRDGDERLDFTFRLAGAGERIFFPLGQQEVILSGRPSLMVTGSRGPEAAAGSPGWKLAVDLAGGDCQVPALGVEIKGIEGRIPLTWPRPENGPPGTLAVRELRWQGRPLGALEAVLTPRPTGLGFTGRLENRLWSALAVRFSGNGDFADGFQLAARVTGQGTGDFDLGRIDPAARGALLSGGAAFTADVRAGGAEPRASLEISLTEGTLLLEAPGLKVEGLSLALAIPDLFQLDSAPQQVLAFARAELGDLVFHDGEARFQVEGGETLFVEEARFRWCEGNLFAQPFRVSAQRERWGATLFCDRVNLAGMLKALGIADASGEGALNGRIPFYVDQGNFGIEDGFLYSTPGTGGTIRMTGAEGFAAGIPMGSPEGAQVALAREALRDFDYHWATLKLDSENDALCLQLSVDGKPGRVLPFVYRRESGGFEKAGEGHPGSRFQGIRLDVNFNLPLNTLLQYKGMVPAMQ